MQFCFIILMEVNKKKFMNTKVLNKIKNRILNRFFRIFFLVF